MIVLTSSDSPADKMQALRLGATHYIRKPTGLDDFLAIGATIKEIVAQANNLSPIRRSRSQGWRSSHGECISPECRGLLYRQASSKLFARASRS